MYAEVWSDDACPGWLRPDFLDLGLLPIALILRENCSGACSSLAGAALAEKNKQPGRGSDQIQHVVSILLRLK